MRRIVVAGGLGFFGATVVERLRAEGAAPLAAARRAAADLRLDVEDPASLRLALRPADVVVDAVGPFQDRTTALAEAALEIGFDLIDLADSRAYVQRLLPLGPRFAARGNRLLTACSSVSAVSAALVRHSGVRAPLRVTGFLAPATQYAANPGSGASLLRSVGRPVQVLRDGRLTTRPGWRDTRALTMPAPIGRMVGRLYETADPLTLPAVWPSLRTVDFYVDSRVFGLNPLLDLGARLWPMHWLLTTFLRPGLAVARRLGSETGCLAYEIEGADGQVARPALIGARHGHYTPVAPAVLAALAIARGEFGPRGLVRASEYVEPERLIGYLDRYAVRLVTLA
ncbi:MAG: hypothetical protein IT317_05145 [Anaerolineales bacterium]|nr:hypothetical protein [Anaerolineales bacterium]